MSRRYVPRGKPAVDQRPSVLGALAVAQAQGVSQVQSDRERPSAAPEASPPADAACPGSCNAAFRRAEEAYAATGQDHDVPYRPGRPVWCESVYARHVDRSTVTTTQTHVGCIDRIGQALIDIEHWLRDVPSSGPLLSATPSERHGSGSPPSQSPAFDERDALERWLADMTGRLAERAGHVPPPRPKRLAYAAQWLTALLSGPDAEADGKAILSWERRLRLIVGANAVTRMPGVCPGCDARGSLRHRNASDLIRCLTCGLCIEWDDYHAKVVGADVERDRGVAPSPTRSTSGTRRPA